MGIELRTMNARFTEEQELLRRGAREMLARECPMALVRAQLGEPLGGAEALWKRIALAGWTGLGFAEEMGGAGLGLVEQVVLLEELGRVLAPGPYFSTTLLGGAAIDRAGDAEQRRRWLPGIASGATRATLALLEDVERWDGAAIQLGATRSGDTFRLDGVKRFVLEAASADLLVVAARTGAGDAGVALFAVDAGAPGVAIEPVALLDGTRKLATLRLTDVVLSKRALLPGGWPALAQVLDRAKVALCAEMIGGAERVLELSVAYAKTREQFGQPIGSFQAIQHKCADMLVALEAAKSATYLAAWALQQNEADAPVAAAMAKAITSDAFAKIAGDGIQIHGGLGFTWEQDLHLYYKRAKVSERLFGDGAWNRELVARARIDGA
jgi:alkylation response protein AidB-like acyl-CoA dehydrogenase